MNNQTLTQLACKIVALRSAASPTRPQAIPQPLTYKSGGHSSGMIALFLPISAGAHFALSSPKALPPNELHVTLAYLGKVDDLSSEQVKEAHDLMRIISENHPPLPGHINGCGRFCNGDDDGDPFFIIPDLAALPNLRQVIIDGLKSGGVETAKDHGFVPHITLIYLPHAEHNPFHSLEKTPVSFGAISLVLGDDRYDYPLAQDVPLLSKAALIQKIGARHTQSEAELIQKIHNLTLDLGGECHPLTRRAGARHSQGDQVMVQRIHDDCSGLGAMCKATPEKDRVYSSQVLKEGKIIKAQSDAPNYKPASTPQRCANCRFFLGDPGRDWCDLFDFTADPDYVSDAWEPQRPDEIPGYVANKGVLTLRNWENSTLIQRKARDAVNNAIKAGILKKANTKMCFRCDKRPGVEYHHIDGYSENKKLNVRAVCYECHSSLTRKAGLAALTEGILTLRGSAGSGNFGHIGRPGKLGGSADGGGLKRIGAKKKSSPAARKKAAKKFGTKQAAKGEPTSKKPAAKPKKPAKKLAAKPKPQPVVKPVAAKKPTIKPEDQGLNQKDAKKFGWLSKEMAGIQPQ
jgi:2'-5' RNA ligase